MSKYIKKYANITFHKYLTELRIEEAKKLLITTEDEQISIMVGEEDHLRIQVILPDFELE